MNPGQLTLDSRIRPSDKTLFRNVEGEAVLLGLNAGSYFGLDPVGTRMWELIAERGLLRDVVSGIVAEFEVDAARVETDLLKLVSALLEKQLVELAGSGPHP
ncbi:MAG: PqqD family protein [Myxococcales bacterium]